MDNNVVAHVGQKAIIEKDGKILILKVDGLSGIDLPGGRVQEGETDLAASLQREVREETGLEIEIGAPFDTFFFVYRKYSPERRADRVFLVTYLCRYVSGEVNLSKEHSAYHWIDKNTYKDFDDSEHPFPALEKYFKNL